MKLLISVILLVMLASCAPTIIKHECDCRIESKELFSGLSSLAMSEGMSIKTADVSTGVFVAESDPVVEPISGATIVNRWQVSFVNNKVLATAKSLTQSKNAFGATLATSETYYNQNVHKDHAWYWSIRNYLESKCGKIVEIKSK